MIEARRPPGLDLHEKPARLSLFTVAGIRRFQILAVWDLTLAMYYTIGGFTLDDTVLPDGEIRWSAPGGNALYSAMGAKMWGVEVGIITPIGMDYPQGYLDELAAQRFDLSGICRIDHPGFHVWILHENQNRRQILYRLDSGSNASLDPRPQHLPAGTGKAQGVHICPILGASQAVLMEHLFALEVPVFLDLIVIPDQIEVNQGHRRDLWPKLRGFLPSLEEVIAVWGKLPLSELVARMEATIPSVFAIKLGSNGCLVREPQDGGMYHIPAFSTQVVDTTGAGDAFCGGFMVGLQETGSAIEAALYGAISASFVIEDFGAMHALRVTPAQAEERLAGLRTKVRPWNGSELKV